MEKVILFRKNFDWNEESDSANTYFKTISQRVMVNRGDLVIPRFSCWPFYKELQNDVELLGGQLLDTFDQYNYIADLGNWYYDLKDYTPKTWANLYELPEEGKFILKGETNSKKYLFDTHMFAGSKRQAIEVHGRLLQDTYLQEQKIYIREFVELDVLEEGLRGLPITREYRFFVYKDKILCGGYYWASHYEELVDKGIELDSKEVPLDFLNTVIRKVQDTCICEPPNFYVIDVAKTARKDWVVIELNYGGQSGLSMNDSEELYGNLRKMIDD